jgi:hypothetical protein
MQRSRAKRIRVRRLELALRRPHLDAPAVDHGQTGAAVAQRDRQVEISVLLGELERCPVAGNVQYLAVAEPDPLGRVVLARGNQDGLDPGQQRALGQARRACCPTGPS